jgi:hypothetical protein
MRRFFVIITNMKKKQLKVIIYISMFIIWVVSIISVFLKYNSRDTDKYSFSYQWNITKKWNIVADTNFSWTYKNNTYNINHDIHLKENNKAIISLLLNQNISGWTQHIVLQNYTITTGLWNHRIRVFEQEILKPYKNKQLLSISNTTWFKYTVQYKQWLREDIILLQGTHTNQDNQKNHYNISLQIYCGIWKYIIKHQQCEVTGKIIRKLPIDNYTRERTIQWKLYKAPLS